MASTIGLEALSRVCRDRIADALRIYQRAPDRAWPHFVPELHVPRSRVSAAFARFLETADAVFVLEGLSGSGKSSEMLRLAGEYIDRDFPLFVRLTKSGCEVVAPLERELECSDLPRALAGVARATGRRALLFIDNGDACDFSALHVELNRLASRIERESGAVRMIVACRPRTWRALSREDELESPLARGRGEGEPNQPEGTNLQMPPLRGAELERAFELGAKYYRVTGELTERLQRLCASPELLRLLLMSSRDSHLIPGDESDVFARLYVQTKRSGVAALKAVAEHVVEANIGRARPALEISRDDILDRVTALELDVALESGLLEATEDEHGRASISFRAQWVLDYCVAFYVLRLDKLSKEQLRERVDGFRRNLITFDALAWFLGNAGLDTVRAAHHAQEEGARRYAEAFTRIAREFMFIADGGPQAYVTLIADPAWGDVWHDLGWGPVGTPPVSWVALDMSVPGEWRVAAAARKLDKKLRPQISRNFFLVSELEERAAEEVSRQFECFWKDRDLDPVEVFGIDMAREIAWVIAVARSKELRLAGGRRAFSIDELEFAVALELAYRAFGEEKQAAERARPNRPRGPVVFGEREHDEILALAREAVSSGVRRRPRGRTIGSFPLLTLERALEKLRAAGVTVVDHPLGDPEDVLSIEEYPEDQERQQILARLFALALAEFRATIAKLFAPRIVGGLDSEWLHPVRIEVDVMNAREFDPRDHQVDLAILVTRAEHDQIAVRFVADRAENIVQRAVDLKLEGRTPPNILSARPSTSLDDLFHKPSFLTLENGATAYSEERGAVLWLLVSGWIEDAIRDSRAWLSEQVRAAAMPARPPPATRSAPLVFISYGTPDELFARRLYAALQNNGVRVFFFPETAPAGSKIDQVVRDGIYDCDRMLLVCSRASLDRPGVKAELSELLARELSEGASTRLIPVRLDDYVLQDWSPERPDTARSVRQRVMNDFSRALDSSEEWDRAIARLLEVLKK